MGKLVLSCLCASLLLAQTQVRALAAESTYYEIDQTHRSFGEIRISFDAGRVRVDWPRRGMSVFAKAPDWQVKVYNQTNKRQATASFSEWCKSGLGTYSPWVEMTSLEGRFQKKIPTDFEGFKAVILVCPGKRELVDSDKAGISWSMKRKMTPMTMNYTFLDGVKIDSHIPKIVAAIYLIDWDNRLLLSISGQYDGTSVVRRTLKTNSIKILAGKKFDFNQPTGFKTVPMAEASQGNLDFFN